MTCKIAVITPYYKESTDILLKGHTSVLNQNVDAFVSHFMIADGFPNPDIKDWNIKHIVLPEAHSDNGNTPRGIGSHLAVSQGYDFIAYLDADNWFHPNHLSSLLDLWKETGADVCCSSRTLHKFDGTLIQCSLDEDELNNSFVDTSCYLLGTNAFGVINLWINMPKELSPICDRVFFAGIKKNNYKVSFTSLPTLAFRSQYLGHYVKAGLAVPEGAKGDVVSEVNKWLLSIDGARETARKIGFLPI